MAPTGMSWTVACKISITPSATVSNWPLSCRVANFQLPPRCPPNGRATSAVCCSYWNWPMSALKAWLQTQVVIQSMMQALWSPGWRISRCAPRNAANTGVCSHPAYTMCRRWHLGKCWTTQRESRWMRFGMFEK